MAIEKMYDYVSNLAYANNLSASVIKGCGLNGLCINTDLEVIKGFGDTSAYLSPVNFRHNLDALFPDTLLEVFRTAVHRAFSSDEEIVLKGFHFNSRSNYLTDILLKKLPDQQKSEKLVLVIFKDRVGKTKKNQVTIAQVGGLVKEHLADLERQITTLKQELLASDEQLISLNENLNSFNQELILGGETMQSANKELYSINEELQNINMSRGLINKDLIELNDDLNNYFSSNLNGQLFVDRNLLLKKYSPAAIKHINIRESDIGRPLGNITTNIKFDTLIDDLKIVIEHSQTIIREAESSDGKVYQVMTMPYFRQNSKAAGGAVISFYDITALSKISVELDASNKVLVETIHALEAAKEKVSLSYEKEKELSSLKSRFVSMASHEFRTPLSSIQLSTVLIEKYAQQLDTENIKKHTVKITASVNSLVEILNDLLLLEKLEAGTVKPSYSTFDLVKLAESISEEMQLLTKPNQQIIYQHTGETSLVKLNVQLLKNCIINLITNSIKYSGENTFIEFNTEINATTVKICVKDNGIGIPEEDQKYLFEAFFRAHNTGKVPGTGLGLNIVTRYTKLMNGKISFQSRLKQGTSFTITFPSIPAVT